jgi:hypothetical protein
MNLTPDMTLDDFRDEMQHRVVKYSLRSKQNREAMRFARRHRNRDFYRVAIDKYNARKQYEHELYGPSRLDRLFDLLNGTPRDVALTLLMVVVVLVSLHFGGSWLMAEPDLGETIDVDRLAKRMGFYISERHAASPSAPRLDELEQQVSAKIDQGIDKANIDQALAGKFSLAMDRARFDEVAAAKVGERLAKADLEKIVAERLTQVLDQPTLKQLVINRVDQHIAAAGIKERVLSEFDAALTQTKLDERIATLANSRLTEFDQALAQRVKELNEIVSAELRKGLDVAAIDKRISDRITAQLTKLDAKLDEFDKHVAGRLAAANGVTSNNAANTPGATAP